MRKRIIALLVVIASMLSACGAVGNSQPKEDSLPALGDGRRPANEQITVSGTAHGSSTEKSRGVFPDGCEWVLYHSGELEITGEKLETSLKTYVALADELSKVTILTLNVNEIGDGVCRDLPAVQDVRLGDSVRIIGNNAFSKCANLNKVEMSAGLEGIGDYAFQDCAALWSANIPEGVRAMGRELFVGCAALHSITIASDVGESSFSGCTSLTDITFAETCKSIGKNSFRGCTALRSITVAFDVGESSFSGCTSLTDITFTETCKIIGKNGFSGCTGITSLKLGKGVERIEEMAFSGCENIEYIYIPASITYYGKMILSNANRILQVEYESKEKWFQATKDQDAFKNCTFKYPQTKPKDDKK